VTSGDLRSRRRALVLDDELRSCLATIVGYAVLLDSEDRQARRDVPRRIVASIQHLSDTLERRAIEAAAAAQEAASIREDSRRALFIDEEPDSRNHLKRMLPADIEVVEAEGADDALRLAGDDVTFAVLSWRASSFSPPETLAELTIRHPNLPVLVIAEPHDGVYKSVAEVLGANAFLTRPVNSLQLLAALDDLLRDGVLTKHDGSNGLVSDS